MSRVLVLFAHPRLEKSRINRALLSRIPHDRNITVRDLYQLYPDFNINVVNEQDLLAQHDIIVLHHPLYWYSIPPLLKQWIDLVYSFGWAYGPGGTMLQGKTTFHVLTTGGATEAYTVGGYHGSTLAEFLLPLKRTATLCGMTWLPPFAVHGTNKLNDTELERIAAQYASLLSGSVNGALKDTDLVHLELLNEAFPLSI